MGVTGPRPTGAGSDGTGLLFAEATRQGRRSSPVTQHAPIEAELHLCPPGPRPHLATRTRHPTGAGRAGNAGARRGRQAGLAPRRERAGPRRSPHPRASSRWSEGAAPRPEAPPTKAKGG